MTSRSRRKKSSRNKNSIAIKTNPKLWESIKNKWIRSSKAGAPGKISARKMQLAVQEYKRRGGKYKNSKSNRRSTSLHKWTKEKWGYISESRSRSPKKSRKRYGRYLPKIVRSHLTSREKRIENSRKGRKRGKWIPYSRSVSKKMHKYGIIR